MAVTKVGTDARDDRYEVRLYNPVGGGRYKKVIRGKRAADLHEAQMRLQLEAGGVAIPGLRTITFEDLMEHVLAARPNLAPNTVRSYRNSPRLHLYPVTRPSSGHPVPSEPLATSHDPPPEAAGQRVGAAEAHVSSFPDGSRGPWGPGAGPRRPSWNRGWLTRSSPTSAAQSAGVARRRRRALGTHHSRT